MTRRAVVEILGSTESALGLGFVVEGPLIVTCAHVVNAALGREPRDSTTPKSVDLNVRFPYSAGTPTLTAGLRHWAPDTAGDFDSGDLALLSMDGPLPGDISPFGFADTGQLQSQPQVHIYGPVPGRADGGLVPGTILGPLPNGRLQLNQEVIGTFRAVRGFSGGPAWLVDDPNSVAGMLVAVAVPEEARDVYVLGVERLKILWPKDLAFPTGMGGAMEEIFVQGLLDSPDLTSVFLPALGNVPFDRIFVAPFVTPYDALDMSQPDALDEETALEAIFRVDRAVLVAGPGMGKTTFLRFLTRSLAADRSSGTLPVLISLSSYVAHDEQHDLLSFGLHNRYGAVLRREELERLDDAARVWNREGRLLFLLDGLDEVAEDRRRVVVQEIAALRRFVVASRPMIRMPLDEGRGTALQLAPMNHASVIRFVRNWASGVQSSSYPTDQVLQRLRTDARLGDLARTPQLLGLICWLAGRGSGRVPLTRLDLLERAVRELIHSAVERGRVAPDDVERLSLSLRGFLRQFALERLQSTDEASVRFTREEFAETAERLVGADDAYKLTRLAFWSGLVIGASGNDDDLQFLHLVFQEYLAAEALARSPDLASTIDRVRFQSDCEECLRMACGILSARNEDQKLRVILERILHESGSDIFRLNYRLAAQCLAQVTDADRRLGPMVERVARSLLAGASEWWARDTFADAASELQTPTARKVLAEALRDEDRFVRWAAAEGLGRMAHPESLEAIMDALSQERWPPIIASLIEALGLIGDPSALAEVTSRAEVADGRIRRAVGAALGRMNAIKVLDALLDRPDDIIGEVVIAALSYLPTVSADRLIEGLARKGYTVRYTPEDPYASADLSLAEINDLLLSPDVADHLAAAKALARRSDWAACERLAELLSHEDDAVFEEAVRGLLLIFDDHVALNEVVHFLIVMMLNPDSEGLDWEASALLRLWMSDEARAAIEESAPQIFEDALDEGDRARVRALSEAADPSTRAAACWVLAHSQDHHDHDQLLKALGDNDDVVRWVAAWSIGRNYDPTDGALLLDRLASERVVEIRATLANVLGLLQVKSATAALIELLREDADEIRAAAVEALGRIGEMETAPTVTRFLTDPSASVRHAAATALGLLRAAESAPVMAELLDHEEDPAVVIAILNALGDLSDESTTEAVIRSLNTTHDEVRIAALEALGRVGHQTVGPDLLEQLGTDQSGEAIKSAVTAIGRIADAGTIITAAGWVLRSDRLSPVANLVAAVADRHDTALLESLVGFLVSQGVEVVVAPHTVELTRGDQTTRLVSYNGDENLDGESPDPLERWDAVQVWGAEPQDAATVLRVAARLRDEDAFVARAAAEVLSSLADDPQHADLVGAAIGDAIQAALRAGDFDIMVTRLLDDRSAAATYPLLARLELLCPLLHEYLGGVHEVRPVLWDIGLEYGVRMLPDGRIVTAAGEVLGCEEVAVALERSG